MKTKSIAQQLKEDWLLYFVFFLASTAQVMLETFAIIFWIVKSGEIKHFVHGLSKITKFILYIIISSLLGLLITGFPADKMIIQIGQLSVYMCIYYLFMQHYRYRLHYVYNVYVKFALFLAVVGIIQYFVARFFSIKIFYIFDALQDIPFPLDDMVRARGWVGEPANFALYLIPALAYCTFKNGLFKTKTLLLIFAAWLAFTPIFKIILILLIIYYLYRIKMSLWKIMVILLLLLVVSPLLQDSAVLQNSEGENKMNETFEYFNKPLSELETANMSTYSFLKNLKISIMADNRITGTGIGTHGYSHDKYYVSGFLHSQLNQWDAYSLGTRIFSELGVIGILVFFWFFIKNFNKNNIVNISIIFYFMFAFLRGGHYTISGAQFFLMMYFFTSKYNITENDYYENHLA